MKRLSRFVLLISLIALCLAGAWVISQYAVTPSEKKSEKYDIYTVSKDKLEKMEAPKLPDISEYTIENVIKKIPSDTGGEITLRRLGKIDVQDQGDEKAAEIEAARIEPLENSYEYKKLKLNRLIPMYGEMQGVLEPVAIEILTGNHTPETILKAVNEPKYFEKKDDWYIAHVPILIGREATVTIMGPENRIRMASNTGSFISNFGKLFIIRSAVEGWDTVKNIGAPFVEDRTFRPHIVSWCGSEMYLASSIFRHLGYFASKAYGISYSHCFDPVFEQSPELEDDRPYGWIIDNVFDDLYYGFYSYEADDLPILRNIYANGIIYGIDPHDRSNRLIIGHNVAYGSKKKHGIIVSREVNDSWIFNNTSYDNTGSGFMVDRSSRNNVIAYNKSFRNGGDGLTFYESPDNVSFGNILYQNKNSGLRIRNSWDVYSRHDKINENGRAGVQGYTADLTADGKTRDLVMDPYEQVVSLDIASAEMVGNVETNFKFENIEFVRFSNIRMFNSPEEVMSGDLRNVDVYLKPEFSSPGVAIQVSSKKAKEKRNND